ncbi:MAG: sulfurtransferase TusA family protein [Rhodobacteraceae bacterium]|nr:sulfurtransferase TusA family protein [Paracoccaceae bacterium]
MTWDAEIDCEGLLCPLPVLKARKRLMGMTPGQVLRIRATDAMAAIDLPHFCTQAGHGFLEARQDGPVGIYLIRRGARDLDEETGEDI